MEDLFYPGYWSTRPVRPRGAPPAMVKPSLPAKVVSIPVHFVGSDGTKQRQPEAAAVPPFAAAGRATERINSSTAALAIQRAFRGFLVRKNLKAVRRIEAEVDAVEKEVAQAGDRLRRDERERLRVNEALMALLFRLDSVRGVREYRRRVIRRAIALQEAVDAIATVEEPKEGLAAAGNDVGEISEGNASLETPEAQEATPAEITRSVGSDLRTLESHNEEPFSRDEDTDTKKAIEEDAAGEVAAKELEEQGSEDSTKVAMEELHDRPTKEALCIDDVMGDGSDAEDTGEASEDGIGDPLGDADKCKRVMNGEVETGLCPQPEEMPSSPRASAQSPTTAEGAAARGCRDAPMRQAMERMAEESRGLKGLVAELCERNEVQLRLMDGLLQRVERLEKVVDNMGRKKQKTQGAKKPKRPNAKK